MKEAGIPLEKFSVPGSDGRPIAAYRLGDPSSIRGHKLHGRSVLPRALGGAVRIVEIHPVLVADGTVAHFQEGEAEVRFASDDFGASHPA